MKIHSNHSNQLIPITSGAVWGSKGARFAMLAVSPAMQSAPFLPHPSSSMSFAPFGSMSSIHLRAELLEKASDGVNTAC